MRIAAAVLLMVINSPSLAEWVKIVDDRDLAVYGDPATIRKSGTLRRMWELRDLKGRDAGRPQSGEIHFEYDCFGDRVRMLETIDYSESMGKGRVLSRYKFDKDPPVWVPIRRRSSLDPVLRFVCGR